MKSIVSSLRTEILKLKRTPVVYLALAIVLFITFILFIGHYLEVHPLAQLNLNPWKRYLHIGPVFYSTFFICPLAILLTSAFLYVEQRANAWKYLYTMPVRRGNIYFSKLITLIGVLIFAGLVLIISAILSGYFLNSFYPEFEFDYYQPPVWTLVKKVSHATIAVLGVIGIHYFLSLYFKNFFIPLGIGIIGFIFGLILGSINNKAALYCPYSFPVIVMDFEMFNQDNIGIIREGRLSNVEWHSIGYFMCFMLLGYWNELRRNIS